MDVAADEFAMQQIESRGLPDEYKRAAINFWNREPSRFWSALWNFGTESRPQSPRGDRGREERSRSRRRNSPSVHGDRNRIERTATSPSRSLDGTRAGTERFGQSSTSREGSRSRFYPPPSRKYQDSSTQSELTPKSRNAELFAANLDSYAKKCKLPLYATVICHICIS